MPRWRGNPQMFRIRESHQLRPVEGRADRKEKR